MNIISSRSLRPEFQADTVVAFIETPV